MKKLEEEDEEVENADADCGSAFKIDPPESRR